MGKKTDQKHKKSHTSKHETRAEITSSKRRQGVRDSELSWSVSHGEGAEMPNIAAQARRVADVRFVNRDAIPALPAAGLLALVFSTFGSCIIAPVVWQAARSPRANKAARGGRV